MVSDLLTVFDVLRTGTYELPSGDIITISCNRSRNRKSSYYVIGSSQQSSQIFHWSSFYPLTHDIVLGLSSRDPSPPNASWLASILQEQTALTRRIVEELPHVSLPASNGFYRFTMTRFEVCAKRTPGLHIEAQPRNTDLEAGVSGQDQPVCEKSFVDIRVMLFSFGPRKELDDVEDVAILQWKRGSPFRIDALVVLSGSLDDFRHLIQEDPI